MPKPGGKGGGKGGGKKPEKRSHDQTTAADRSELKALASATTAKPKGKAPAKAAAAKKARTGSSGGGGKKGNETASPKSGQKRPRAEEDGAGGAQGDGAADNKRRLRQERQAERPLFNELTQCKKLWNELREKKCTAERRKELVGEMQQVLRGKYREVALKHDGSRLVQSVVQYGDHDQRLEVLEEVGNSIVELSRSPYAHFVVTKLIEFSARSHPSPSPPASHTLSSLPCRSEASRRRPWLAPAS
jgi:hypothetical protein